MNTRELFSLCEWFSTHAKPAAQYYGELQAALRHNATQPQKQPVRDQLNKLLSALRSMPMHELNNDQIHILEGQNVVHLTGAPGAKGVEKIVKSARFDPATANAEIQQMHHAMNEALRKLGAVKDSLLEIEEFETYQSDFDQMIVRIHFKDTAAISDVAAWKEWSNEWFDIVRGIAMCVDEAPENVRVLGARQGSVIMILGATAGVTALLLLISNHLTKIALNGLQVANAVEDLKQKVKLNQVQVEGLEKSIADGDKNAVKDLVNEAKESLPKAIDGGQENALINSITKFQNFTRKGGEVDFLAPPDPDDVAEMELDENEVQQITEIRETLEELRNIREETRLLTNQQDGNEYDFEDEDLNEEK